MTKEEARGYALSARKKFIYDQAIIIEKIRPYLKNKKIVGIYYPLSYELDLRSLEGIFSSIKFVYPAIDGNMISFKENNGIWTKGLFHTIESNGSVISKDEIDLIITPLLAINKDNYRIGYGKGYYDRYLSDYHGNTLGIIKKELLLDFKEDEYDIKIKDVIFLWQQL